MDGVDFARMIERELAFRGIKKGDFYRDTGISATALYNWKRGSTPSLESIATVEKYFDMDINDQIRATAIAREFAKKPQIDPDTAELLESIRKRPDLGVLLKSARDVPPSSVYELVSKLEKMKEEKS